MLGALLVRALSDLRMLRKGPVAFVACMLLVAVLGVLLVQWHFSEQVETQSATIKWQDDQLARYREKLDGASPLEAASEISNLRKQIEMLETQRAEDLTKDWPVLTEAQISQWAATLAPYHPSFIAIFYADGHSEAFRDNLLEVFKRAGWPISSQLAGGASNIVGIGISVQREEPAATALARLFGSITSSVEMRSNEQTPHRIHLYIGERLRVQKGNTN